MRFILAILALSTLLWFVPVPAPAQSQIQVQNQTPLSEDEYNNIQEGVLMPKENTSPHDNAGSSPHTPAEEEEAFMTIEDMTLAYSQGKYDLIVKRLLPLAENGQHQAEQLLGLMYLYGQGVPQNVERALIWLTKAAEANLPLAQHYLAIMLFTGNGVPPDLTKALMWLHITIAHYPVGMEKNRAIEDRNNLMAQVSRRDKERALDLAREFLAKNGEGHLLDDGTKK